MDNKIERVANSGIKRTLIEIGLGRFQWEITMNPFDITIPALKLSPTMAQKVIDELTEHTKFYRSDYYRWGQRKIGKEIPKTT